MALSGIALSGMALSGMALSGMPPAGCDPSPSIMSPAACDELVTQGSLRYCLMSSTLNSCRTEHSLGRTTVPVTRGKICQGLTQQY